MKVIGGERREELNQVFQVPNLSHHFLVRVSFQNAAIFNLEETFVPKDLQKSPKFKTP